MFFRLFALDSLRTMVQENFCFKNAVILMDIYCSIIFVNASSDIGKADPMI